MTICGWRLISDSVGKIHQNYDRLLTNQPGRRKEKEITNHYVRTILGDT